MRFGLIEREEQAKMQWGKGLFLKRKIWDESEVWL